MILSTIPTENESPGSYSRVSFSASQHSQHSQRGGPPCSTSRRNGTGAIKIGHARLAILQVGNPSTLTLLATTEGGRSQYKGISWAKRQRKWMATISVDGRDRHLGYFDMEDDAARAYDAAAVELYGEFAQLNFQLEVPH